MSRVMKDIRRKCLDCCGNSPSEVRLCELTNCSLHPYRMGTNPFRKSREISNEQRAVLAKRLADGRRPVGDEEPGPSEAGDSGYKALDFTRNDCLAALDAIADGPAPIRTKSARIIAETIWLSRDGYTIDELVVKLEWPRWLVQPQVRELEGKGFIRDSGKCRPSNKSVETTIWVGSNLANVVEDWYA